VTARAAWRILLGSAAIGVGLQADGQADPDQIQRFATSTEAVRVDVLVTHDGRMLRGLTAQDFELRDDGVLQQIDLVDEQAEPISLVCLIDTSDHSRANAQFAHLIDAGGALVDALEPHDRVALVAFSNRTRILSTPTTDHASVKSMFSALHPEGVGSLRDAVFAGLVLRQLDPRRTLLLVFSHGWGLGYVKRPRLLEAASRTDVVVYGVTYTYRDVAPMDHGSVLDSLAEETGGRVLTAEEGRDLTGAFVNILAEFRRRYVLAYVPTGVKAGGWHQLQVTLKGRSGKVRARRGYFVE